MGDGERASPRHVSSRDLRALMTEGTIIDEFTIHDVLGRGGFGDVYRVTDPNRKVFALKTEYLDSPKQALEQEIMCLRRLKSPSFPQVHAQGTTDTVRYMVMDVLGPSLGQIRRKHMNIIPRRIAILLSLEMLKPIKEMHEQGFVHRDIKPSNFLLQKSSKNPLVLVDFGLAAPYINFQTKEHMPFFESRFCGTRKYASLNAFKNIALSRRDDLQSWFNSILEMFLERLPWSRLKEYADIAAAQENLDLTIIPDPDERLLLTELREAIFSLEYDQLPDYALLESKLRNFLIENYGMEPEAFNWVVYYDTETNYVASSPNEEEEKLSPKTSPRRLTESRRDKQDKKKGDDDNDDVHCKCLVQ